MIIYPFVNILVLIFLGFGLSYLILPKSFIKSSILWLSPWTTIIVSIFYFVVMSLIGFSVDQAYAPFITALIIINIYVLTKVKPTFNLNIKENLILGILVSLTLILNLSPIIRHDKMLTTISMGNNDVIVYTNAGDYLKNHSVAESYKTKINLGVKDILQIGYRWGTPMINAFFLKMLNLQGYQYTYAAQAVLFSLFIPLVYILFRILFGRPSIFGLLTTGVFTGFNVNLLYMLYHDFFGQVLFWGIEMLIFIFFYGYFNSREILLNKFNRYDFILGIIIAVFYYSYHEPAIFMFTPLLIFLLIALYLKKKTLKYYFWALLRIAVIGFILSFKSIINAFIVDYIQVFILGPKLPMGWQLFRSQIPYANPFEALGFWSIHNFEPLPTILAVVLSIIILIIFIKGITRSQSKVLTISYLVVFSLFFFWTGFYQHNFFAYNRTLTYILPLLIVLFSIGLTSLFEKQKLALGIIAIILISLELWSAVNLNKRFIKEHLSVEKSFVSIMDLKKIKVNEPIYAEYYVKTNTPFWNQIWTDHFLYETNISALPTVFNTDQSKNKVPDNSLVLVSKPVSSNFSTKVILKNVIWENEYYKLGRFCDSDDCLLESNASLSEISIGKSDYEDTLLLSGWGTQEGGQRWANEKESRLRLVVKGEYFSKISITAVSLKEPEDLVVYIDNDLLGTVPVDSTQWKTYELPINYLPNYKVHQIKFVYSNGYRPMDVIPGNLDGRILYVNFKEIKLQ